MTRQAGCSPSELGPACRMAPKVAGPWPLPSTTTADEGSAGGGKPPTAVDLLESASSGSEIVPFGPMGSLEADVAPAVSSLSPAMASFFPSDSLGGRSKRHRCADVAGLEDSDDDRFAATYLDVVRRPAKPPIASPVCA